MKKTNFSESVERFKERIKTDKKFKTEFTTIMVASVVVISTAIAVPTAVHNHKINTEENTVAPIIVQGENEIESLTEEAESTANEEFQPASEVSETDNTETEKPTENKARESKNNSSNSQNKNNISAKKETTTATAQTTEHVWTQAEVDELVNEALAYARKRGFTINPNLNTVGTSWRTPATTYLTKARIQSRLKYLIDQSYDSVVNCLGYFDPKAEINVLSIPCAENEWEIYVVY